MSARGPVAIASPASTILSTTLWMNETKPTRQRERLMDPWWRKARIAARLIQKKEAGQPWTARDQRLAKLLANDPGVTNRLLDQAWWSIRAFKNGYRLLDRHR